MALHIRAVFNGTLTCGYQKKVNESCQTCQKTQARIMEDVSEILGLSVSKLEYSVMETHDVNLRFESAVLRSLT